MVNLQKLSNPAQELFTFLHDELLATLALDDTRLFHEVGLVSC